MARIRSIKPDFFMDEETATLPPDAQLLLIGLWTLADRDGRLEDKVRRIKAQVFPYREVDVETNLAALEATGVIQRYASGGHACIQIVRFLRDQRPHPKETSYDLPGPETASRETSRQGVDTSRRVPVVVGCGSGSGSGSGSFAGSAEASPQASLLEVVPKPEAKPKKPKPEPTGDPRHTPLVEALCAPEFRYAFRGGHDAKAVKDLLRLADSIPWTAGDSAPAEIVRRWRICRAWVGFPSSPHLAAFAANWNAYADPQGAAKSGPPGAIPAHLMRKAETHREALLALPEGDVPIPD